MADYDSGEVTERERLSADRQKEISAADANAVRNQLARNIANFDMANQQNRRLADVQLKQLGRKADTDRFQAQRNLRNATLGLLGEMGNTALNSSSLGNLMRMLEDRADSDNVTYWDQLQTDRNTIENAYQESLNQNTVSRNEAAANAEKGLADINSNLAANLNNINPNLYEAPDTEEAKAAPESVYTENAANPNLAVLSGYIMPDDYFQNTRRAAPRNQVRRPDYFGSLINGFNRRYI